MVHFTKRNASISKGGASDRGRKASRRMAAMLMELEPRIAFDAALPATLERIHDGDGAASGSAEAHAADRETSRLSEALADGIASGDGGSAPAAAKEIVFVDPAVEGYRSLIATLPARYEVVVLDPEGDGIAQIAAALGGRHDIEALHIVSHGAAGRLDLGTARLDLAGMTGPHAETLQRIGQSLSADADILLYGCDFGQGPIGAIATGILARLTGADVAASDDPTGAAGRGGDWDLERRVGTVEADLAFDPLARAAYADTLNVAVASGNGAFIAVVNRTFYSVDATTGKATAFTTAPATVGGVDLSNQLNSVGIDAANGLIYYTDNETNSSNRALLAYDIVANAHIVIDSDLTNNGAGLSVSVGSSGVGGGAGGFYNGKFYLGVENVSGSDDQIYAIGFSGNGRTVASVAAFGSPIAGANDWGDFTFDAANNTLLSISSATITRYDVATGAVIDSVAGNASTTQGARDALGQVYRVGTSFQRINPVTGVAIGPAIAITTDGTSPISAAPSDASSAVPLTGSIGDAVFDDNDGDGAFGAGDVGVANVTVQLVDDVNGNGIVDSGERVLATDVTSATGAYLFTGVLPGSYVVRVTDTAGVLGSARSTTGGTAQAVTISRIGGSVLTGDFGWDLRPPQIDLDGGTPTSLVLTGTSSTGDAVSGGTFSGSSVPVLLLFPSVDNAFSWSFAIPAPLDAIGAQATFKLASIDNSFRITVNGISIHSSSAFELTTEDLNTGEVLLGFSDGSVLAAGGTPNVNGLPRIQVVLTSTGVELFGTRTTTSTVLERLYPASGTFALPSFLQGANTIAFVNTGGLGNSSVVGTLAVTAPDLDYATGYVENGTGVSVAGAGVAITDLDSANMRGATIVLTNAQAGDVLSVSGALPAGIAATVDTSVAGRITLRLSGDATIASYQTAIRQVLFSSTSDVPSTTARLVTVTVSDGGLSSNVPTTTISVTSVNDAPVNGLPPGYSTNEDTSLVLSGLSVADPDAGTATLTVTLSVGSGTLGAASGGAVTVAGSGTASLTLTGTLAAINAYLASASAPVYAPVANASGSVALTMTTSDGGSSGIGGTLADTDVVTITVVPVNDAPTNALPAGYATNEDTSVVLSGLSIADIDAGTGAMTVTLSVGSGTLAAASGGAVTAAGSGTSSLTLTGTLAAINAYLASAAAPVYAPLADANGAVTLTMTTNDNGNTGGPAATDTDTATIAIAPVNDAPVLDLSAGAAGTGYATSYTENGAGLPVVGADVLAIDVDNAALASATVTISNGQSGDVLQVSGALPAGISASYNAATFTMTLTGSASKAAYQAALLQVRYLSTSDTPSTAPRLVQVSVGDGQLASNTAVATISVVSVNDAPVNALPTAYAGSEDASLVLSGLSISDVDAGSGIMTVTLSVGSGTLAAASSGFVTSSGSGTSSLTLTGTVANLNAYLASASAPVYTPVADANGPVALTMTTSDNGNTGGPVATDTDAATIAIAPVADLQADTATTAEDTAVTVAVLLNDTFSNPGRTITAVNGTAIASGGTVAVASGTVTLNAAGTLTFAPAANFNGSASFTYAVSSGGSSETGTVTVSVTPVNDAPVNAVPGAQSLLEDGVLVFSAANGNAIAVADVDSGTLTVTLSVTMGRLTLSGVSGLAFATGDGVADATMRFSGTAAAINAALSGARFDPDADANGAAVLTVLTSDGSLADTDTVALSVAAVADIAGDNASTPQNMPVTIAVLANDSFEDPARAITAVAGVSISAGGAAVAVGNGSVALTGDGKLIFTPTFNYSGSASFTYTVTSGGTSETATVFVSVASQNAAPTNTLPAGFSTLEDGSLALSGLSIADPDAGSGTMTVMLSVNAGTLTALASGGVAASGSGTGTLTLSGTLAQINAYLAGAQKPVFTPVANDTASVTLTLTTSDNGNTGGPPANDIDTATIAILPVNDAPSGADTRVTIAEDGAYTFSAADFGFSDAADMPRNSLASVVVRTLPATGTLTLAGTAVAAGQEIAAGNLASLVYAPAANANGTGLSSFTFQVRDNGGTANGGVDLDPVAHRVTFDVTAVNDAPVVTMPASFAVDEDTGLVLSGLVLADVDAGAGIVSVTFAVGSGTVSATAASGVAVSGSGTGTLVLSGTLSDLGAFLSSGAAPRFLPAADAHGTVSLVVTANDGGQAGLGGALTGTASATITVRPVNDAPVGANASISVAEDGVATGQLPIATDADGDALTYAAGALAPQHGTLTIGSNGSYTYRPAADYDGTDSFSYTVGDGTTSSTYTVSVFVSAVQDAPVARPDAAAADAATAIVLDVLANDGDADGDALEVVAVAGQAGFVGTAVAGSTGGLFTIASDGTMRFDPAGQFAGLAAGQQRATSVSYTISDGQGGVSVSTVTVTVTGLADAPMASAITPPSVVDRQFVVFDTAPAFSDPDAGDSLTFSATGLPAGLSIDAATGRITGRLDRAASVSGPYSVTVRATDASGLSASTGFVWTIVNPAPVAANDQATTAETIDLAGSVLADNGFGADQDPDGDALFVAAVNGDAAKVGASVSGSNGGTFAIAADGGYSFVQGTAFADLAAGQSRTTSVTYTLSDGQGGTSLATLAVTVSGRNDAPVAAPDGFSTSEDAPVTFDVLLNDRDVDGGTLAIVAIEGTSIAPGGTVAVGGGRVTLNANGTLTFVPAADVNGTVGFAYTLSDGQGGTSTGTVTGTIAPVEDAPQSLDDRFSLGEDMPLTFDVRANDGDADGDVLTIASIDGQPIAIGGDVAVAGGTVRLGTDGRLTFTPAPDVNGTVSFRYTLTDGHGGTSGATVTLDISPVADAPRLQPDSFVAVEDQPATIAVLANDRDPDGDPLTIVAIDGTAVLPGGSVAVAKGVVTLNADGTLRFTPSADAFGATSFTYSVSDGQGGLSTASVSGSIQPVNDQPVGRPIADWERFDGDVETFDATAYFTDADGDALIYSATGLPAGLSIDPISGVVSGQIAPGASGSTGTAVYAVEITARDQRTNGDGTPSKASVAFRLTVRNLAPVALDDTATTAEDTPVDIAILANDGDPDGDTDEVIRVNNVVLALGGAAVATPNGSVRLVLDGGGRPVLRFAPRADFHGTESFTYTISDGNAGEDTASVTVVVSAVNDAPVAAGALPDGSYRDGEILRLDLSAAFADVDGDALSYTMSGAPLGLSMQANGIVAGTIDRGASQVAGGVYAVTVTARDPSGLTSSRTFAMTVSNPAPTAVADTATVAEDQSVTIDVGANDVDPDGDTLVVVAASAGHGTVTISGRTIRYTPALDFNGSDTITYTISDGNGGTSTASVAVTVTPVNDAPIARPIAGQSVSVGETVGFDLSCFFEDADGDTLSFSATGLPSGLSVDPATGLLSGVVAGGTASVTPYRVEITASDARGGSVVAVFDLLVGNDPPSAIDDMLTVGENAVGTGNVLLNDVDGSHLVVTAVDGAAPNVGASVRGSAGGRFTILANGDYSFDPGTDFDHLKAGQTRMTTVTYRVRDADGDVDTARLTVTVVGANDAPASAAIPALLAEDGQVFSGTLSLASFFADIDGDALAFSATGLPAGLSVDARGVLSGTLAANASQLAAGGVYTVVVTASDGTATSDRSFSLTVGNPAPVAASHAVSTAEDTAITFGVLGGPLGAGAADRDPDGDAIRVAASPAPSAAHGTVVLNADGTLTYRPDADYFGSDTITYLLIDADGGTAAGVVDVTVTSAGDAPVAAPIPDAARNDGDTVVFDVTGYFRDADGDRLTYAATGLPAGLALDPVTGIIAGRLDSGASGPTGSRVYVVQVTASDGQGGSAATSFRYTITNLAPAAFNDAVSTPEDTPVDIDVLGGTASGGVPDRDPDGDVLQIVAVNGTPLVLGGAPVATANGSVRLVFDGSRVVLRFAPAADFVGTAAFAYTISDANGGEDTANVVVTVTAVNDAPVASLLPDLSAAEGAPLVYDVSSFFSDVDRDALRYTATGLPAGLSLDPATGVISGTVDGHAGTVGGGVYRVTITASDRTLQASASFDLRTLNPSPIAGADIVAAVEDTAVTFNPITGTGTTSGPLGIDRDPDGDSLAVVSVGGLAIAQGSPVVLAQGLVSLNADGSLTFAPAADFNGTLVLTYRISDGEGGFADGVATILVAPRADAPVVDLDGAAAGLDAAASFTEGDAPVAIAAADATIFDAEGDIVALRMSISAVPDGAAERILLGGSVRLTAGTPAFGVILFGGSLFAYDFDGAAHLNVRSASGTGLPLPTADLRSLVASLRYENAATDPTAGTRTFSFAAIDATGLSSAPALSRIRVIPIDGAPVATDDAASTDEDTVLVVSAPGLLANDRDAEGDALAVSAVGGLPARLGLPTAGSAGGLFTIRADGSYRFDPAGGFDDLKAGESRVTRISYRISDPNGSSATAMLAVTVHGVNDAPAAADATIPGTEDTAITGRLPVAVDAEGDALVYSLATPPAHGTVSIEADGRFTYVPAQNYAGTDSFRYAVGDGVSTVVRTISINLSAVPDAPVAPATLPEISAADGAFVSIDLGASFSDPDGDALLFTATGLPAGLALNSATGRLSGTLTGDASQTGGGVYAVTITATDGAGQSASVALSLRISNPGPVAEDDRVSTTQSAVKTGSVFAANGLGPDRDPDGDPIFLVAVAGSAALVGVPVAGSAGGLFTLRADGTFRFDPGSDFVALPAGAVRTTSVSYAISDGQGGSASAVLTVEVTGLDDAPTAAGFTLAATEDTPVSGRLPAATDPDGDVVSYGLGAPPAHGTVSIGADGRYTYTPAADFAGTDSFVYTVSAGGLSTSHTVAVSVAGVNDAPVAVVPSAFATPEDTPVALAGLSVADPDGGTDILDLVLSVDRGTLGAVSAGGVAVVQTRPGEIRLSGTAAALNAYLSGASVPVFTPVADSDAPARLTVTSSDRGDGLGGPSASSSATAVILVAGVNDVPVVSAVSLTTAEDRPVAGRILAVDADGDGLGYTLVGQPAGGSVRLAQDGSFVFTPDADLHGTVSFSVRVDDGHGGVGIATVTVVVTSVNDLPVGSSVDVATSEDASVGGRLPAAVDADGDALTYALRTGPAHGSASVLPDGRYVYTPAPDFNGTDSFTYAVGDGEGWSVYTVSVTVAPVADAPTPGADAFSVRDGETVRIDVLANDVDADGDLLRVVSVDGRAIGLATPVAVAHGSVSLQADGSLRFTADRGYAGLVSFDYGVSDPSGATSTGRVSGTVRANAAPVVSSGTTLFVVEDVPAFGRIVASDGDGDALTYTLAAAPSLGAVQLSADGSYVYRPTANAFGRDSFQIRVDDGHGGTTLVLVDVAVAPVNDAPDVSGDARLSTVQGVAASGRVVAVDPEGDAFAFAVGEAPRNGTLVVGPDGRYTYTPDAAFTGGDRFSVSVSDSAGGTTVFVVEIAVAPSGASSGTPSDATSDGTSGPDSGATSGSASGLASGLASGPASGIASGGLGMMLDYDAKADEVGGARTSGVVGFVAFEDAEGEVLKSIGSLKGHGNLPGASGVVGAAADFTLSLGGTADAIGAHGVTDVAGPLARWDRSFSAFEAPQAKPFLGGSSLAASAGVGTGLAIDAQTQIVDGLLYCLTTIRGPAPGGATGTAPRLTLADGRALPGWLTILPGGALVGRPPAGLETLSIRAQATGPDGAVLSETFEIDLRNAIVKRLPPDRTTHLDRPTFSDLMRAELDAGRSGDGVLLRALRS